MLAACGPTSPACPRVPSRSCRQSKDSVPSALRWGSARLRRGGRRRVCRPSMSTLPDNSQLPALRDLSPPPSTQHAPRTLEVSASYSKRKASAREQEPNQHAFMRFASVRNLGAGPVRETHTSSMPQRASRPRAHAPGCRVQLRLQHTTVTSDSPGQQPARRLHPRPSPGATVRHGGGHSAARASRLVSLHATRGAAPATVWHRGPELGVGAAGSSARGSCPTRASALAPR